jgi:membrane peptidoglycan carboxypeptidase
MITQTLESNVRGGTGRRASLDNGMPAGGKTGTAQNSEDAWFVGFSPYITTAVWMGHPDEKIPMRGVAGWGTIFGGTVPAAVWGQFNNGYHALLEAREFADPDGYGGGRYLKVEGETDFCSVEDIELENEGTTLEDTDGDGIGDCYVPITTTTLPCPDGSPPPEDGVCPPPPPTTEPPPTTTAPPATTAPPPTTAPPAPEPPPTEPPAEGG